MQQAIEQLHRSYCELTRLDVACTLFRHFTWEAFLARGFNDSDLVLVCKSLRRDVDKGKRTIGSMSFHRLVGDLEYFEELLAEFRSLQRKPRFATGKASVLAATQRPAEPVQPGAKKAKDVVRGLSIAERLRQFRKGL